MESTRYDLRSLLGSAKLSPDAKVLFQYLILSKKAHPDRGAARMLHPRELVDGVAMSEDNIIYAVNQLQTADLCQWDRKKELFHVTLNTPWLRLFEGDLELTKQNRELEERVAELEAIKLRKPSAKDLKKKIHREAGKKAAKTRKERAKARAAEEKKKDAESDSPVHVQKQNPASAEGSVVLPGGPSNR